MFLSAKISSFSLVFRNCNYYNKLVIELRVRPIQSVIIVIKQNGFALRAHPILLIMRNDNRPNNLLFDRDLSILHSDVMFMYDMECLNTWTQ